MKKKEKIKKLKRQNKNLKREYNRMIDKNNSLFTELVFLEQELEENRREHKLKKDK